MATDGPSVAPPAPEPAQAVEAAEYLFGPFRLSVPTRELRRDGVAVPLTAKTFDTLVVLVQHRGRVVSKDELMKAVWNDTVVSDDSLTQNIKALRRALGDDANQPVFIATLARRGYRFIPPVIETPADEESAGAPTQDVAVQSEGPVEPLRPAPAPRPVRSPAWWIAAAAAGGFLAALALGWRGAPDPGPPPSVGILRLTLSIPENAVIQEGGAVSPDGQSVAYVAARPGRPPEVWMTDLQAGETRPLPDTAPASRPFWSPDGRSIAFFSAGSLKTVPVAGGASQTLAQVRNGNGGTWSPDGRVLFADLRSPILAVGPSGGASVPVTTIDASQQEVAHLVPQMLPDGRHFLYFIQSSNPAGAGTFVGSLDGPEKVRILDVQAVYASGALLFVRNRVLFAQRFDPTTYRLSGDAVTIAGDVAPFDVRRGATLSASNTGLLSYGGGPITERLVWFDRTGKALDVVSTSAPLYNMRLSADKRQILAASRPGDGPGSIWTIDLARGVPTRLTTGMRPVASPDGTYVAFTSDGETGVADIYLRPIAGANRDELLVRSNENKMVDDWTRDGTVVFASTNPNTKADLWVLPVNGDRMPKPFLQTAANELHAQVSPDGRWVAYASDETGSFEVHVQSFPVPGDNRTVSVGGGSEPHWRADGRELYYLAPDGAVMAVDIEPGTRPELGKPQLLFRVPEALMRGIYINNYDVSADGRRFLLGAADPNGAGPSVTLVVNWPLLLPR